MAGLPFQSMPAAGTPGGPAAEAIVNGETVRMGTMRTDPATGKVKPVYSQADYGGWGFTGTQANAGQPTGDPVDLAVWQGDQAIAGLVQYDKQEAVVKAPVQHALNMSHEQYLVDVDATRNSGLDQDQQKQRINQLNATYQKKWIAIKSKIKPQIQAIQKQKADALRGIQLDQTLKMKEIQVYAQETEAGRMEPDLARALQFRALGYSVPLPTAKKLASQDPYQVVQRNRMMVEESKRVTEQYTMSKAADWPGTRFDKPGQLMILRAPIGRRAPTEKDYRPATKDEMALYYRELRIQDELREGANVARDQLLGKRVTDLMSSASPMASGISRERPRSQQRRVLTDQEIDALLDEVGGDTAAARRLAQSRGQSF